MTQVWQATHRGWRPHTSYLVTLFKASDSGDVSKRTRAECIICPVAFGHFLEPEAAWLLFYGTCIPESEWQRMTDLPEGRGWGRTRWGNVCVCSRESEVRAKINMSECAELPSRPNKRAVPSVGWTFPVDCDTAGYRGTNASSQQSSTRLPLKPAMCTGRFQYSKNPMERLLVPGLHIMQVAYFRSIPYVLASGV